MKLPLVNEAEVPRAKIVLYLLDPNHRSGKSKARFFSGHGYAIERWQELAARFEQKLQSKLSEIRGTPPTEI